MPIAHNLHFIRRYVASPGVVGAVAPSSRRLGQALAAPFARRRRPARVLEVGAGTGAVTRVIASLLGADDHLDICEIEPVFADMLERDMLRTDPLAAARADGRVRLIRGAVQNIDAVDAYDYVICGLPFTAFPLPSVQEIFSGIRKNLKPGGVFSYFEYLGLRRLRRLFTYGARRKASASVSDFLDSQLEKHQIQRRTIVLNLPPAYARHLRFGAAE